MSPESIPSNKDGPDEESSANTPVPLTEAVYQQLRAIAERKIAFEPAGHTLQATALVHEAYLRLGKSNNLPSHLDPAFLWAAAEAMRRILIEHARAKKAVKRGGGSGKVSLPMDVEGVADLAQVADPEHIESLDRAISRLESHDKRAGEVVRLRFFAGLSLEQAAVAIGLSTRTAIRDWNYARTWLMREIQRSADAPKEPTK